MIIPPYLSLESSSPSTFSKKMLSTKNNHKILNELQSKTNSQIRVTGHWVKEKPVLPEHPDIEHGYEYSYLMHTNMNITHAHMNEFKLRALRWHHAHNDEIDIMEGIKMNLQDENSPAFQQSAHMAHVQRADLWLRKHDFYRHHSEEKIALQQEKDTLLVLTTRRASERNDEIYNSAALMFAAGEEGPLTKEQSARGISLTQIGNEILREQRCLETNNYYDDIRTYPVGRIGHPSKDPFGVDLSQEKDSVDREKNGIHVLMGTSASTSDWVRSHIFALHHVQQKLAKDIQFEAPTFTREETDTAAIYMGFQWMRESINAEVVAELIDHQLNRDGRQRISAGPRNLTQTHSYHEVETAYHRTRALNIEGYLKTLSATN